VLNADFRPLSYFPLSLLSWQDAITAVFKDHVSVVAEYDKWVSSPSTKIRLPSVVALRDYIPMPKRVAFTRFNVFLRDRFPLSILRRNVLGEGSHVRARHPTLEGR
jgi:5-methylcytosine-specific restriction endonuclease McrA